MKNTDIFGEWETYLISFLGLCLFGTYLHFKYKLTYWNRRKIFQVPGRYTWVLLTKFILTKKSISELLAEIYKKGRDYRYIGFYTLLRPTLLIRDPELIKMIMVKDHEYFKDRGFSNNENENHLAAHLFFLSGLKWKYVHNKVNPIYSDDNMKFIFGTLKKCTEELNEHLMRLIRNNDEIDFKKLLADHSINVIANSVIGIEGHDLSSNSDFHKIARKVTASNLLNVFRYISPMVTKHRSPFLTTKFTPSDIEKYYINLTKSIVEYRRKNNIVNHDLMHLLIETGDKRTENGQINNTENENELSLSEMAAQTFTFILSAYETNYSTICFCLYELAMNSKVQEKLQSEVDAAGSVKDVTYDKLLELPYLDQVIKETWRKYPPSGVMFRECNKTYNLPHGKVIESGTTVIFSSLGLHQDPEYFPDPETFDPERFNKYLPTHRVKPYSFLPFGAGPRLCTGKLFAEMQSKLTLYSLVSQFEFEITNKTIVPTKFQPRTFLSSPAHGIYLQAIKRNCT